MVTYSYGNSDWKDLLISYDGTAISYDASGNPLNWTDERTITWVGRQLDSIMSPDGARWAFKYDHNGLRTEREYSYSGEVILRSEYTWVDEKLVKEYRSGGMNTTPITLEYFYNGEDLIGFSIQEGDAAAVNYYYGKTNNGEIRFIYDANGNIVTTYRYDAWGNPIPTDESSDSEVGRINPFRYKSYYYDSETRLYYLRSRSYDPAVGRFLNADSTDFLGATGTVLSFNLFAYCENNPINSIDETGFLGTPIQWVMAAIGGIAGWYFGDYVAKKLGYKSGWKYWAIRAGVVVGGSVIGWFAGSLVKTVAVSFLQSHPHILAKMPSFVKWFLGVGAVGGACFTAGTLVKTQYGYTEIENLDVGDSVYSKDVDTGEISLKKITRVFSNSINSLVLINIGEQTIVTTENHPFWIWNTGWVEAKNIKTGDVLYSYDGLFVNVISQEIIQLSSPITVYNIEVEQFHTYFVTTDDILVHNANCSIQYVYELQKSLTKVYDKLSNKIKDEATHLISQYMNGNKNPGLGSKYLKDGIYYLRGKNGARVFYRMVDGVMQILGISDKPTEPKVIELIEKIFG